MCNRSSSISAHKLRLITMKPYSEVRGVVHEVSARHRLCHHFTPTENYTESKADVSRM